MVVVCGCFDATAPTSLRPLRTAISLGTAAWHPLAENAVAGAGGSTHPWPMNTISRRHFLQSTAAGTLAVTQIPAMIRGAEDQRKLKMGLIGCGWYGMVDAKAALQAGGVEMVALCDIDTEHLEQSAAELEKMQGKRPRTFKQYAEQKS